MMLAEFNPSATTVMMTVVLIISVIGNASQFGIWWNSRGKQNVEISPTPITVELQKKFADKHDFDQHVAENNRQHTALAEKLEQDRRASEIHISQRQKTIFDALNSLRTSFDTKMDEKHEQNSGRLNHLDRLVGKLESATDLQNQQLARMETKLDRVAERKVAG